MPTPKSPAFTRAQKQLPRAIWQIGSETVNYTTTAKADALYQMAVFTLDVTTRRYLGSGSSPQPSYYHAPQLLREL